MTLKGQYALRDVSRTSFGARHETLKEDRRILTIDSGVTKTRFFVISGTYNFGTFRAEAKITIRRHEVVYRLSSERKIIDLE